MTSIVEIIKRLSKNNIGVIPTDTIYGLVGRALSVDAVERIYKVRNRDTQKPLIILIASLDDIARFDIKLSKKSHLVLSDLWGRECKRKTSIILACPSKRWQYLDRGTHELTFRLVHTPLLQTLINAVGPLVAPSANPQGAEPAHTIVEAQAYFGDSINFYGDDGRMDTLPSRIIRLEKDGDIKNIVRA